MCVNPTLVCQSVEGVADSKQMNSMHCAWTTNDVDRIVFRLYRYVELIARCDAQRIYHRLSVDVLRT